MKIKWKALLICIAIPLVVGGIAAFISKDSMSVFETLNKPPLPPPGWLFPVAWTILYTLMGIASYLIVTSGAPQESIRKATKLYGVQLLFNFLWTLWFFNLGLYFFAFIWLVILLLLILATMIAFAHISKPAMYLMLPYLLWVTFAGYLNLGIALLN
ncbi:MAG: tryptophan-rich sensory protein [Eubacteriales bacterium]|nr:tryptophan-rich sensory protein [Eubacteriales bacterium]